MKSFLNKKILGGLFSATPTNPRFRCGSFTRPFGNLMSGNNAFAVLYKPGKFPMSCGFFWCHVEDVSHPKNKLFSLPFLNLVPQFFYNIVWTMQVLENSNVYEMLSFSLRWYHDYFCLSPLTYFRIVSNLFLHNPHPA